jgi:hypothetical protein
MAYQKCSVVTVVLSIDGYRQASLPSFKHQIPYAMTQLETSVFKLGQRTVNRLIAETVGALAAID